MPRSPAADTAPPGRTATGARRGWVAYLVAILIAVVCLYLLAWPIVRRVVLHQDDEVAEELHRQPADPDDDPR